MYPFLYETTPRYIAPYGVELGWIFEIKKAPEINEGLKDIIKLESYETLQHPQVTKYTTTANTTTPIAIIHFLSILFPLFDTII